MADRNGYPLPCVRDAVLVGRLVPVHPNLGTRTKFDSMIVRDDK
jgi:hypothetical protein